MPEPDTRGSWRARTKRHTVQTRTASTGTAYSMWVWTQNVPTPHATGRAQRSPHVLDQASRRKAPNGRTVTNGFHGSVRKSLGRVTVSRAMPSAVAVASSRPPQRRASTTMVATATAFTSSVARSMAVLSDPRMRYGIAIRYANAGPGWLQLWRENGPSSTIRLPTSRTVSSFVALSEFAV